MKYLQNYIEEAQTEAFKKAGAFFAFSNQQFDEQKKEGVEYVSMGAGMICDKEKAKQLIEDLENIHKEGIVQDIAENGIEAIIKRELANHEAEYTGDISDTYDALKAYEITWEQIDKVFRSLNN